MSHICKQNTISAHPHKNSSVNFYKQFTKLQSK
ncbi:unnamed protein product [Spirodela intermedia]|uniref:Uncharacterized protein n=1 Tax=Spirodela intermedia TaxID=51605 RepID=A0A7I8KG74_SPIIN|nr:unnamed protein product [Spirodela intermedia]